MRFMSRVGIIGTLMAVMFSLLVILPVFAGDGTVTKTAGTVTVEVRVYANGAIAASDVEQDDNTITTDAKDTKVGNTLFVSNSASAFNQVYLNVVDTSLSQPTSITVDVKNATTGVKIKGTKLTLLRVATNTAESWQGTFNVVSESSETTDVSASDGDTIEVTFGAVTISTIKVDAAKPVVSDLSPESKAIQTSTSRVFAGTVTDAGSGLRTDSSSEDADDNGTTEASDRDADGVTNEPLPLVGTSGKSKDIQILIATTNTTPTTDESGLASDGWVSVTNGFRYTFTRSGLTSSGTDATITWRVDATDRVGNQAQTDSNADTTTKDHFKLTIDQNAPQIEKAEAGIGWDAAKRQEKDDDSSIKVTFRAGSSGSVVDNLDNSTVDTSGIDFRIDATTTASAGILDIASVVHPNLKSTGTSASKVFNSSRVLEAGATKNIVYIKLANDLAPDAVPEVNVLGDIRDLAGNGSPPHDIKSTDKILPTFDVTVTGGAGGTRPIADGDSDHKITIRIVANENVSGNPSLWLTDFNYDNTTDQRLEVLTATSVSLSNKSKGTNIWEVSSTAGSLVNRLVGVHVSGLDTAGAGNRGNTSGITSSGANGLPVAGDKADLSKMSGRLFEFDDTLAAASFTLTPNTGTSTETESANPFLKIDFSEGKEYNIAATTDPLDKGDKLTFGTPAVSVEIDSHNGVTLTKLELVDQDKVSTDLLGTQGTVDSDSFVLALAGLAVGEYTVNVNGTDAVGNKRATNDSFNFTVKARSSYSVALNPGWNLVSLPATPSDPDISSVFPATHPATTVLTFVGGEWKTAVRGGDNTWEGTISQITSEEAYWVQTGAFTPIKTLIPERNPATVLPAIPIVAGWNLVPIVDLGQASTPTQATLADRSKGIDPDIYFASITWTVAYGFDTQGNAWRKITPSATVDNVGQGKGYWVWATKAGQLVP